MTGKKIILSLLCLGMLTMCIEGQLFAVARSASPEPQSFVAGQFYPGSKAALTDTLKAMFGRAVPKLTTKRVEAIVVPHAGYIYSGTVAASSYNQIEKKSYKNIFIIGSSHKMLFNGAAIYLAQNFVTPLGAVKVDQNLSQKLKADNPCFTDNKEAFIGEHTIEVQLPFLQYKLGNELNIVAIVLGTQSVNTCQSIAKALRPYFNSDNLFVFSTDLSHYPGYSDAQQSDKRMTQAVISNSPDKFLKTINEIEEMKLPNLQTTMCGWTSVLTLLDITRDMPGISYKLIDSKNSGDSPFGDKNQVVGYAALAVEMNQPLSKSVDFLTPAEKQNLLAIARQSIEKYLNYGKVPEINEKIISKAMLQPSGAFVTLYKKGQLRGCIGNFSADQPLFRVVQSMAVSAAVNDYRFEKVTAGELDNLDIEISVLTPMMKIKSIDEIVLGRDGIYIRKGKSGGTFLPQVAAETGWTKEEFLGHCAQDKAGIGWNGWKNADIFTYQALVFGEKIHAK